MVHIIRVFQTTHAPLAGKTKHLQEELTRLVAGFDLALAALSEQYQPNQQLDLQQSDQQDNQQEQKEQSVPAGIAFGVSFETDDWQFGILVVFDHVFDPSNQEVSNIIDHWQKEFEAKLTRQLSNLIPETEDFIGERRSRKFFDGLIDDDDDVFADFVNVWR